MIYKSVKFELKDMDKGSRTAVTKFATYNNLDVQQDIARKGMITKSVKENFEDIRFFVNHNPEMVPGKPLEIWEDDSGAYAKSYLGTHTLGEDVLKMMDEGIITNMSFSGKMVKYNKIKGKAGHELLEVALREYSAVTHWGANPLSKVMKVQKSLENDYLIKELQGHLSAMETFCRNTTASDECIKSVLVEIEKASSLISNYDTESTPLIMEPQSSKNDNELVESLKQINQLFNIKNNVGRIEATTGRAG